MVRILTTPGPGQGELPLTTESAAPVVSADDVRALVGRLRERGWVTAAELAALLGEGWTDRKVRAVASAAVPGVVSYPGSKGYKLWEECSVEEIAHCMEAFESQAKLMTQRALLYRAAYHSRFRGTGA